MRDLFHLIPQALSDADIAEIMSLAQQAPAQDGTVFSTATGAETIRNSTIRWLDDAALRQRLWQFVTKANDQAFGVSVTDQADMQFTSYDGQSGGHYDWHHDVHWSGQGALDRKISLTIQLSDPDSYSGGDFEFEEVKTTAPFKSKGTMILFPSYLRHKVSPVTSGVRHSLVAWFFGPRWR